MKNQLKKILAEIQSEKMAAEYNDVEFHYKKITDVICFLDKLTEEVFIENQYIIEYILFNLKNTKELRDYLDFGNEFTNYVDNDFIIFFIIKKQFNIFRIIKERFETLTGIDFDPETNEYNDVDRRQILIKTFHAFKNILLNDLEIPLNLYGFVSKSIIRYSDSLFTEYGLESILLAMKNENVLPEIFAAWSLYYEVTSEKCHYKREITSDERFIPLDDLLNRFPYLCMDVSSLFFLNMENPYYLKEGVLGSIRADSNVIVKYALKGLSELSYVLKFNDICPTKADASDFIESNDDRTGNSVYQNMALELYKKYTKKKNIKKLEAECKIINKEAEDNPSRFNNPVIRSKIMKLNKNRNVGGFSSMFDYEPYTDCIDENLYYVEYAYRDFS